MSGCWLSAWARPAFRSSAERSSRSSSKQRIASLLICSCRTESRRPARPLYIAGCDGAHSTVREAVKIGFPGGIYNHLFYVADVQASGATMNGELHIALDRADFLAVFPLKGEGRARLVGTLRQEAEDQQQDLSWNDVSRHVLKWISIDVERVNWFSTYRVHHRVAAHFRQGRAFLLGDAAHIHSPVGGQGMNTGIGDAVNLAWKLAAVVHGQAGASLLDSYEPERIAFARRLVATTDRAFTAVTSSGAMARLIRLHLVPLLLAPMYALKTARRVMFLTVSQTGGPLPWKQLERRTRRNRVRWRPPSLGEIEARRQLQGFDFAGLAGPRIR